MKEMKANLKMIEILDLAYKELTREIAKEKKSPNSAIKEQTLLKLKEKKDKLQLMILNEMAQY